MGLINRISRHAAVAAGNFGRMFKGTDDLPALPSAAMSLLRELNREEPEAAKLQEMVSNIPGLAARILRHVNSPLFALANPVSEIHQAVVMLGFKRMREMTLTYAMMETVTIPPGRLMDSEQHWLDSLLRAMVARAIAGVTHPGQEEEAYTAGLLADVAIPLLITGWSEYYESVLEEWLCSEDPLATVERRNFGWDHGQAAAWLLDSWEFPERITCFVATHTLSPAAIGELQLADTPAVPLAIASALPSVIRPTLMEADTRECMDLLQGHGEEIHAAIAGVKEEARQVMGLFELSAAEVPQVLDNYLTCLEDRRALR